MHKAVFCENCGNLIATGNKDEVKIQHRGRTIRVYGSVSVSIQCEKCGRENIVDNKDLCGLCGNDAALSPGETSHARCV